MKTYIELLNDIDLVKNKYTQSWNNEKELRIGSMKVDVISDEIYHITYSDGSVYFLNYKSQECGLVFEHDVSHISDTAVIDFVETVLKTDKHESFAWYIINFLSEVTVNNLDIENITKREFCDILRSWFIYRDYSRIESYLGFDKVTVDTCIDYFYSMKWL